MYNAFMTTKITYWIKLIQFLNSSKKYNTIGPEKELSMFFKLYFIKPKPHQQTHCSKYLIMLKD